MSDMIIMIIQITPILVICSVAFSWIKRLLIIRKYKEMEQIKLECDIKKILHYSVLFYVSLVGGFNMVVIHGFLMQ